MTILVEVIPRYEEAPEKLLKRFTRKCKREDIMREARERREFKSKKQKQTEKRAKRKRNTQKRKQNY